MTALVAKRVLGGLLTLWLVSLLVFGATALLPGNAVEARLGQQATPESVAALTSQLGLDRPAMARYTEWFGGVLQGDFGNSLTTGVGEVRREVDGRTLVLGAPVGSLISSPLWNTAILIAVVLAVLIPLSILIGTITALREGSRLDAGTQIVTLTFVSLPEFVTGVLLVLLFSFAWPILPAVSFGVSPQQLVLPALTLVLASVAWTSRMIRAGVIEVLHADHVAVARLKGLPERLVIRRHVLPNAIGPSLQAFALLTGYLAGGVVVVEYLFAYPGVGSGLVKAVQARDVPVVEAYTFVLAVVYVGANLCADLLTAVVNPRLRVRHR